VQGRTGDRWLLRLGGQLLQLSAEGRSLPDGPRVGVALRAEHLRVGASAAGSEVRLHAVLKQVVYRGANVDHLLELPDGQRIVATSTRREAEAAGSVPCGFSTADIVPLDD